MKKYTNLFVAAVVALLSFTTVAAQENFDKNGKIRADFESRRKATADEGSFAKLDNLSGAKQQLMQFLYAYMPLPDVADHPVEYYLENVEYSLMAREAMPWGKKVPVREFLHFVLPIRVNNEDLDDSRKVFYTELRDRVSGLSMREGCSR